MTPRVDVLALGGTIAMTPAGDGGVTPRLTAADLVAAVPALGGVAAVEAATVRTVPGASLAFDDLVALVAQARARVDAGAQGVVVTQGTDSLEETAYALDLLWDRDAPLVVTGAMRPPSAAGADGPANLLAAVTAAAAPAAAGRGVLVALADELHAARAVAKVHSSRPAAFASPGAGPIGTVSEGRVAFAAPPPPRRESLTPPTAGAEASAGAVAAEAAPSAAACAGAAPPEVALVTAVLGDRGATLRAVVGAGVDGVVLAAMGAGHVPALLLPALEEAVAAVPVAAASRTGAGRLLRDTYAFPGSEADLWRLGLLDAGDLAPLKARVLLALALWSTPDRAAAEARFAEHAAV